MMEQRDAIPALSPERWANSVIIQHNPNFFNFAFTRVVKGRSSCGPGQMLMEPANRD